MTKCIDGWYPGDPIDSLCCPCSKCPTYDHESSNVVKYCLDQAEEQLISFHDTCYAFARDCKIMPKLPSSTPLESTSLHPSATPGSDAEGAKYLIGAVVTIVVLICVGFLIICRRKKLHHQQRSSEDGIGIVKQQDKLERNPALQVCELQTLEESAELLQSGQADALDSKVSGGFNTTVTDTTYLKTNTEEKSTTKFETFEPNEQVQLDATSVLPNVAFLREAPVAASTDATYNHSISNSYLEHQDNQAADVKSCSFGNVPLPLAAESKVLNTNENVDAEKEKSPELSKEQALSVDVESRLEMTSLNSLYNRGPTFPLQDVSPQLQTKQQQQANEDICHTNNVSAQTAVVQQTDEASKEAAVEEENEVLRSTIPLLIDDDDDEMTAINSVIEDRRFKFANLLPSNHSIDDEIAALSLSGVAAVHRGISPSDEDHRFSPTPPYHQQDSRTVSGDHSSGGEFHKQHNSSEVMVAV